jgi:hypothetical protein
MIETNYLFTLKEDRESKNILATKKHFIVLVSNMIVNASVLQELIAHENQIKTELAIYHFR